MRLPALAFACGPVVPCPDVVVYRAGPGRGAPVRRYTIATVGKIAPEDARVRAKVILGSVAHGHDPAGQKTTEREAPTVAELADRFMTEHVEPKRKRGTAQSTATSSTVL